jgi:hypothetical protein
MITSATPTNWRELQSAAARILEECGFTVEIERRTQLARGAAEIDVYAEEMVKGRRYAILCECKQWTARVPQTVVHAFRSVVADSGANIGYIISSAGYQSGAYEAAEKTNIRLVTWPEFQAEFEESWLENHLVPTISDRCDPLLSYTEPLLPRAFDDLDDEGKRRFLALKERFDPFGWLMMTFTRYLRILDHPVPALPLRPRLRERERLDDIPHSVLDAVGYSEFLNASLSHSDEIVRQFRALLRGNED